MRFMMPRGLAALSAHEGHGRNGSSAVTALHAQLRPLGRKADARRTAIAQSSAIDTRLPSRKSAMNQAALPRTTALFRLQAIFAAAAVTLVMLGGIDNLAGNGNAATVAVRNVAVPSA
jgi:hypothetical protein